MIQPFSTLFSALFLMALLVSGPSGLAQPPADLLQERVKILTGPELAGRGSGTPEADAYEFFLPNLCYLQHIGTISWQ